MVTGIGNWFRECFPDWKFEILSSSVRTFFITSIYHQFLSIYLYHLRISVIWHFFGTFFIVSLLYSMLLFLYSKFETLLSSVKNTKNSWCSIWKIDTLIYHQCYISVIVFQIQEHKNSRCFVRKAELVAAVLWWVPEINSEIGFFIFICIVYESWYSRHRQWLNDFNDTFSNVFGCCIFLHSLTSLVKRN